MSLSHTANQPTPLLTPNLLNEWLKRRTTEFSTAKFLVLYMCKMMPRTVNLSITPLLRALLLTCSRDFLGGSARDRSKMQDARVFAISPSFFQEKKVHYNTSIHAAFNPFLTICFFKGYNPGSSCVGVILLLICLSIFTSSSLFCLQTCL